MKIHPSMHENKAQPPAGFSTPQPLDHDQKRKWMATSMLFSSICPGFNYIWHNALKHHKGEQLPIFNDNIGTAGTDGRNILFAPTPYFKLGVQERVFVAAHEVMHVVRDDVFFFRRLRERGGITFPDGLHIPYDHGLYNRAADYVINAGLIEDCIGKPPMHSPDSPFNTLYDTNIATGKDSVVDVIRKLYEQESGGKGRSRKPGDGKGKGLQEQDGKVPQNNGGMDDLLDPGATEGKDPHEAAAEHNEDQWRTVMAAAEQAQKLRGKLPANMLRAFEGRIRPQVPWQEHIKGWVVKRLGYGGYDWRRPCRRGIDRDIFIPGRSAFGVEWVVMYCDSSGSMGAQELRLIGAEVAGIFQTVNPRRLTLFWTDAAVHRIDELTDIGEVEDMLKKGIPGGGGSDCRPVFTAIEDKVRECGKEPDAFVGITDGIIAWPEEAPEYPCVWAVTTDLKAPFGDTVAVKVDTSCHMAS